MSSEGYRNVRAEFCLGSGDDVWGTVQEWRFGIADVIYHTDPDMVPPEWDFRHGILCQGPDDDAYPDAQVQDMVDASECDLQDLIDFSEVLKRYRDMLEANGLSY
jgi:hypothetical protein